MKILISISWSIFWRSTVRPFFYCLPFALLVAFLPSSHNLLKLSLQVFMMAMSPVFFIVAVRTTFLKRRQEIRELLELLNDSYKVENAIFGSLFAVMVFLGILVMLKVIPIMNSAQLREAYKRDQISKESQNPTINQGSKERTRFWNELTKTVKLGESRKYKEALKIITELEKSTANTGDRALELSRLKSLVLEKLKDNQ